jgi:hypothetical protein
MVPKDASDELGYFRQLYQRAVNGVVGYRGVIRVVSTMGIRHSFLGNGMGVVGAAASPGFSPVEEDHTRDNSVSQTRELRHPKKGRSSVRQCHGGLELPTHLQQLRPRVQKGAGRPHGSRPGASGNQGRLSADGPRGLPKGKSRGGAARVSHLRDEPAHGRPSFGTAFDTSQGILSWLARGHSCHVKAIPGGHLRIELRTDDFSNVS